MPTTSVKSSKIKVSASTWVFNIIGYIFIPLIGLICLLPFIILISGSLSAEQAVRLNGLSIFPQEFTTEAYEFIFRNPQDIINAYGITILITAIGTGVGLIFLTMTAFVISRKDFKYRNVISFYFYFTTLFNGGMVCTYIFYIQYYGLKDNLLALILPGLTPVFYMLIMRNFVSGIPSALIESAKIDGAGEVRIFFQIVLPLLGSGLATIGLFMALTYWNDWYNAMLYINTEWKYPLQYMLYNMIQKAAAMARVASQLGIPVENMPTNTLKLAMAVVATGPIILLYPFVQKYFVKALQSVRLRVNRKTDRFVIIFIGGSIMKNTKGFRFGLALVLVFTVFAGCSGGGESSTGDSSRPAIPVRTAVKAATRFRRSTLRRKWSWSCISSATAPKV